MPFGTDPNTPKGLDQIEMADVGQAANEDGDLPSWAGRGAQQPSTPAETAPPTNESSEEDVEQERPQIGINERAHEDIVRRKREERDARERALREAEEGTAEAEAQPETTTPAQAQDDAPHALKVRGRTFEMSWDEVLQAAELTPEQAKSFPRNNIISLAQKNLAAASYHEEYKQRLRTMSEMQGQQPAADPGQHQPSSAGTPPTTASPQQDSDTSESELVEKIVYGTPEEQAEAVRKLKQDAAAEAARLAQVNLRASLTREQIAADAMQAMQQVRQDMPEIETNPVLANVFGFQAMEVGKTEIRKALANLPDQHRVALAQRGFSEATLDQMTDPRMFGAFYADMIAKGWRLPPPSQMLLAARDAIRPKPSQTAPKPAQPGLPDRAARKAGVPSIPQRASAPAQQPTSARKTTKEVVAEMRAYYKR